MEDKIMQQQMRYSQMKRHASVELVDEAQVIYDSWRQGVIYLLKKALYEIH